MARGRLFCLAPLIPGAPCIRHMFVSDEIFETVTPPWETEDGYRRGSLRADLDSFVEGSSISIAHNPYDKNKSAYLARIHPVGDEIWDIRSIDPKSAMRVLGCFAECDVFIALVYEYRKNLDGPDGPLWRAFIARAKVEWRKCFLTLKPHAGRTTSEYVSENFHLV